MLWPFSDFASRSVFVLFSYYSFLFLISCVRLSCTKRSNSCFNCFSSTTAYHYTTPTCAAKSCDLTHSSILNLTYSEKLREGITYHGSIRLVSSTFLKIGTVASLGADRPGWYHPGGDTLIKLFLVAKFRKNTG